MLQDSILLKKAQNGSINAQDKLIAKYWMCFPGMVGDRGAQVDWGVEALKIARKYILSYRSGSFRQGLQNVLYNAYSEYTKPVTDTFYDNEEPFDHTDPSNWPENQTYYDPTETRLDVQNARLRLDKLMQGILTPLEYKVLHHEFYSEHPSDVFYKAQKISQQSYSETKLRAISKLNTNPYIRDLWAKIKDVFE